MGQADIAYMIQRIYEKYNATQNDKKYEERVYMGEDEFRYNLEEMVKKSPIDDKALLYKEIYRNISENSLEIDSNGTITISPKLIIEVEKEIQLQKDRENKIINGEQDENLNNDILKPLSIEEYETLSDEEKDDRFYKYAGWMYDSKEDAAKARKAIEGIEIDTTIDIAALSEQERNGKPPTEEEYKSGTGDNSYSQHKSFRQARWDIKEVFEAIYDDPRFKIFFKNNNGKAKIDMELLGRLLDVVNIEDVTFHDVEGIVKDILKKYKKVNPNFKMPDEAQMEGLQKLFADKDRFASLIKSLEFMGRIDQDGREFSALDDTSMIKYEFGTYLQNGTISDFINSFSNTFDIKMPEAAFTGGQHQYGTVDRKLPKLSQEAITQTIKQYENNVVSIKKHYNEVYRASAEQTAGAIGENPHFKGQREASTGVVLEDGVQNVTNDFTSFGAEAFRGKEDSSIFINTTVNPQMMKKGYIPKYEDIPLGDMVGSTTKADARAFIDKAYNPHISTKVVEETETVRADNPLSTSSSAGSIEVSDDEHVFIDKTFIPSEKAFEASLGDIGDDVFTELFAVMAEELSFGGSTEVEHEPEVEGEVEVVEDAPIGAAAASGLVAEDVVFDEPAPKVNEVQAPPAINELVAEVVEEPKAPEQPGMLAVDTLSNKIKRGLNELGKRVKGIFGKVAGLFGGGSNDSGNNTGTTETGGIVQDAKPPKTSQAPEPNFIQHVDLSFEFLKGASTETRTDETKPKGVDDQTQGFEVDD